MKKYILIILLAIISSSISAQDYCYNIGEVSFYPAEVCEGDSLFLIVENEFCAICDCEIDSVAYNTGGIVFQLEAYFTQSECDFPCTSTDTLFVTVMNAGNFTFNYGLFVEGASVDGESLSIQACDPWTQEPSLSTFPPSPCNTTEIGVVYEYVVSGCDCITDSSAIDISGSDIFINHYTNHGICAAIFQCVDTFWLPILDSTYYDIFYQQLDSYYGMALFSDTTALSICGDMGQSIYTLEDAGITLFPNPAYANVKLSGMNNPLSFKLYNSRGQCVLHDVLNGHSELEIDISELADGVYVLELITEDGTYSGKIIKKA